MKCAVHKPGVGIGGGGNPIPIGWVIDGIMAGGVPRL